MKLKCSDCGKEFTDANPSNIKINELNKRIWCNDCVQKRWKEKNKLLKCEECNSGAIYTRLNTKEKVCKKCGHIQKGGTNEN